MFPELDVEWIFSYHPPMTAEVEQAHQAVRDHCKRVARYLNQNLPDCPEKTLAIRHLQMAMMFANSAIAQHS